MKNLLPMDLTLGNKLRRAIWNLTWILLFRPSPRMFHPWRRLILRLFGAKLGKGVNVYPSCKIWAPWNLEMDDFSGFGDRVDCYSVDKISIGAHAAISQYSFLCTATHDYHDEGMRLLTAPITIGARSWIAADVFLAPGVDIGEGAMICARSSVFDDVPPWVIASGHPARKIKDRTMNVQNRSLAAELCKVCGRPGKLQLAARLRSGPVAWCAHCTSELVLDLPDKATCERVYQGFDAGEIARRNFAAYVNQAKEILMRELNDAGVSLEDVRRREYAFFDYGCGGGHFVQAAQDLGMRAMGMEVDEASVGHAQNIGLTVVRGTLPQDLALLEVKRFDFIKLMHVLEHVPNPNQLVDALMSLLKPSGILVISVPDQNSFPARLKKLIRIIGIKRDDWGFVQPPVHLYGFTAKSLQCLSDSVDASLLSLRRTGPLRRESFPSTPEYWYRLGWQRFTYRVGQALGSGGHLVAVFRNRHVPVED